MSRLAWLFLLLAFSGWTAGHIVVRKDSDQDANILLGITGA